MEIFGFDTEKKWDYENGFYITSELKRIGKILAHYELYKKITDLPGEVIEWLDCGNKDATIYTNERILENNGSSIDRSSIILDSEIIEPCFIGPNVMIKNSKIGLCITTS